jgi:tetratricopeptide (TPR) repeat protein
VGERYYFLGKYDECYNFLKNLLDDKLTRRQYLGIIYRLAEIELMRGETEKAKKHFRKVERLGNKLKIVQLSREKLEGL